MNTCANPAGRTSRKWCDFPSRISSQNAPLAKAVKRKNKYRFLHQVLAVDRFLPAAVPARLAALVERKHTPA
jgi:hypothetical protein